MSRDFSLNGIGRRPTSLLLDDVAESGAGGKVCAIDCVRLGRFGRFVAVDDGMHVVARSGRFLWPATETTAPQSESAQFRLETLCHELRRGGWEQRATGSGRAWYAHRFLPSAVPARPGARENEALGRAPDARRRARGGHRRARAERPPGRADSGRRARTNASGAGRRDSARRPGRGDTGGRSARWSGGNRQIVRRGACGHRERGRARAREANSCEAVVPRPARHPDAARRKLREQSLRPRDGVHHLRPPVVGRTRPSNGATPVAARQMLRKRTTVATSRVGGARALRPRPADARSLKSHLDR